MPKHEFFVDMTCEGCLNAVTRVLNKLEGVQFEIDLPSKKVIIDSTHSVDTLLDTLKKTGKDTSYLGENNAFKHGFSKKAVTSTPVNPVPLTAVAWPDVGKERKGGKKPTFLGEKD